MTGNEKKKEMRMREAKTGHQRQCDATLFPLGNQLPSGGPLCDEEMAFPTAHE